MYNKSILKLLYCLCIIREAVPSLVEGQEYTGRGQEPPPKKRTTLGDERKRNLALEVSTHNCHLVDRKNNNLLPYWLFEMVLLPG